MVKLIVVAVPGAGKTTILKRLVEKVSGLRVVNFGDLMLEEAVKRFGITDRDEMRRRIRPRDYRVLQEDAAKRIAEMEGDVVVDTHAAVKTPFGYYPGLPSRVVETIDPDAIVFLEFRPEDILSRRMRDLSAEEKRRREIERVEDVEEHQKVGREMAAAAANHVSCYLFCLRFPESQRYPYQHAEEAAEAIAELIGRLKRG